MPDETLPPENAAPVAPGETEPEVTHEARANQTTIPEYLESLLVTVILALFGTSFVVQAFKIPSQSMERTLMVGDHLLVHQFQVISRQPNHAFHKVWMVLVGIFENDDVPALQRPVRQKLVVPLPPPSEDELVHQQVIAHQKRPFHRL